MLYEIKLLIDLKRVKLIFRLNLQKKMFFGKKRRNISYTSFPSIGVFISYNVFASGYSFRYEVVCLK